MVAGAQSLTGPVAAADLGSTLMQRHGWREVHIERLLVETPSRLLGYLTDGGAS